MSECEICGEEEDHLIKCKQCGKYFCEYCGSAEEKLCFDCLDEFEDEYLDDDEDWDEEEDEF